MLADDVADDGRIAVAVSGHLRRDRMAGFGDGGSGDAVALMAAYRKYGADLFRGLKGRFALVLVDRDKGAVHMAIDRTGIERIAWRLDGDTLHFSGNAYELAGRSGSSPRVNRQAVFSYLFFHMVPSPGSIFEGVRKLPPAHLATFRRGAAPACAPYWTPSFESGTPRSEADLAEALRGTLRGAVDRATTGETTGAFLSGGLDSSSVAGLMAGSPNGSSRKTFSMGFGHQEYDELRYARIAAARFGLDAREYMVQPQDVLANFQMLAKGFDEPFGNSSALPTLVCASFARSHGITHLLAGDGGDELFAGNERYAKQRVFDAYRHVPDPARRLLESLAAQMDSVSLLRVWPVRKVMRYVLQAAVPLPRRLETWNLLANIGAGNLLRPEFLESLDPEAPFAHMDEVYRRVQTGSTTNRLLAYDWAITLADNDLRKVSGGCALAGVQVSYPMLDDDVIDLSVEVPTSLKMRGTELRSFYKRAFRDILPAEIIAKQKHGFGLPFGYWIQSPGPLHDMVFDLISSLKKRRIFNETMLDDLPRLNAGEDARYYGVLIWVLAMFEAWLEEHSLGI